MPRTAIFVFGILAGATFADLSNLYGSEIRDWVEEAVEISYPDGCITDSECQKHCPPPADDSDCDGGPSDHG